MIFFFSSFFFQDLFGDIKSLGIMLSMATTMRAKPKFIRLNGPSMSDVIGIEFPTFRTFANECQFYVKTGIGPEFIKPESGKKLPNWKHCINVPIFFAKHALHEIKPRLQIYHFIFVTQILREIKYTV